MIETTEIERLYELYKSGQTSDPNRDGTLEQRQRANDVLTVAKASADELSIEQLSFEDFAFVAMQVGALHEMQDVKASKDAGRKPITSRDYQSKIWELPEYFRSRNAPFRPKRNASNEPVESAMPATAQEVVSPVVPPMPVVNPAEVRQAINRDAKEQVAETSIRRERVLKVSTEAAKLDIGGEKKASFGYNLPRFPWMKTKPTSTDAAKSSAVPPVMPTQSVANDQPEQKPQEDTLWLDDPKAWAKQVRQQIVEDALKFRKRKDSDGDTNTASPGESPASQSGGSPLLDTLQSILDAVGVVDPTPITDGANMFVSLGRAVFDPGNAGSHLVNAATSAVSMVPYIGDLAKLGKYGGKAAAKASTHAASAGTKAGTLSASNVIPPPVQPATVNGVTPPPVQGPASIIPSPIQGGAGGGGAPPGGGSTPTGAMGSGIPWGTVLTWAAVGTAIAIGFKQSIEQGKALLGLLKPDGYTGDSFDSAKVSMDRMTKQVDATMPLAKYLPFEQMRRKAFEIIKQVIDWLQSVEQTGKQMIEKNRNLAEYSGTIAVAFNQLDIDRIRRDISKSQTMGGDFKGLAASQSAFESAKQDLFQPFERLQMFFQTKILDFGTTIMRMLDRIDAIGSTIDKLLGQQKDNAARNGLEDAIQDAEKPPQKRV